MGKIIVYDVAIEEIEWAKQKVREFEKSKRGTWRYPGVKAWRGVVGGKKIHDWLKTVSTEVEWGGELNTSGLVDPWDYKVGNFKIEGKTATEDYHRWITPKVPLENAHPKDFYIGAKYVSEGESDKIYILGYATFEDVEKCKIGQKYGVPFYQVPLNELRDLSELEKILNRNQIPK